MIDIEAIKDEHRVLETNFTIPEICEARLISGNHAPNGTEELLAWLLLVCEIGHKAHLKIIDLEERIREQEQAAGGGEE
jgi:hypothetical protein